MEPARVLIVDDNPHDLDLLDAHLSAEGYALERAEDGLAAFGLLEREPWRFDVVLLDRNMPHLGGVSLLQWLKGNSELKSLPVILQSASDLRADVLEGMRAGAYYYLTKPYDSETLLAVVATAARDFAEYKRLQHELRQGLGCLTLIESASLVIHTVEEARDTAAVLANACPDPPASVIGLTELLVNAVEHGNLGITYEEKTELNASGGWDAEVRRRMALPENAGKQVLLEMERDADELRFRIRDDGPGFNWSGFLEVDPRRAFDNHGRGIAIARAMSFDSVEYIGSGSEVIARVKLK
jgi:DNA-binding response OmpR family regulator